MNGKSWRRPPRHERHTKETVERELDLTFYPLTADRWGDFEALVGPSGACAGCWCMWWRLTSQEFREGAGLINRGRFQACVRDKLRLAFSPIERRPS
jgi:hypothetical protein